MKALAQHELRGVILILAGRPKEAAEILAKLASQGGVSAVQARRLALFAAGLMDQGQWNGAKERLQEAIQLNNGTGSPHSGLAEWYLLQGIDPQQALDLLDQANAAPGLTALKPVARDGVLALRFAQRAWALARLSRPREAESAIAEALRLADATSVPGMASLHWHAGMAFDAMGQPSEAREHFQKAAALDPHGKYGKLAAGSPYT